jgi:hypothetical protein
MSNCVYLCIFISIPPFILLGDHTKDLETLAQGVISVSKLFSKLIDHDIIGRQLEPPFEVSIENKSKLIDWIKGNHFTAYHWACTCQAGINGRVADEHFRIRTTSSSFINNSNNSSNNSNSNSNSNSNNTIERGVANIDAGAQGDVAGNIRYTGVIRNLLVGSAASLPELSEGNPHLTVTAFAIALSDQMAKNRARRDGSSLSSNGKMKTVEEEELREVFDARHQLHQYNNAKDIKHGKVTPI